MVGRKGGGQDSVRPQSHFLNCPRQSVVPGTKIPWRVTHVGGRSLGGRLPHWTALRLYRFGLRCRVDGIIARGASSLDPANVDVPTRHTHCSRHNLMQSALTRCSLKVVCLLKVALLTIRVESRVSMVLSLCHREPLMPCTKKY